MSSLSKQEQLCQLIDEQQERIRQTFPAHRGSAIVALTSARDWHYLKLQDTLNAATQGATAHNSYLYSSGWHKALQLCFGNAAESRYVSPIVTDSTLDAWADQVLLERDRLTEGEQVLAHCETAFMRMACHFLYPAQSLIGGCTVELYGNVLAVLIGWALKHLDLCRAFVVQHPSCTLRALLATPHVAAALIEALSETFGVDSATIRRVVDAYSLSHENVPSHCS